MCIKLVIETSLKLSCKSPWRTANQKSPLKTLNRKDMCDDICGKIDTETHLTVFTKVNGPERPFVEKNIHYVFKSDSWKASDWNPWSPCWLGDDFPLFFPPHSICTWCPRGLCNGDVLCLLWGIFRTFNSEEFCACSNSFTGNSLHSPINSPFHPTTQNCHDIFLLV